MKSRKRGETYISCLASNFKQPIADLVDRLLKIQLPDRVDDPPRTPEVDYATTLVVLLVLTFEAWASRARFFDGTRRTIREKKSVLPWLRSLADPKLEPIVKSLHEIYFLRDAIVHNHIWTYSQSVSRGRAQYSNFDLDLSWQSESRKVNNMVSGRLPLQTLPRSKRLNLTVVPSFVGRRDVAIVFKVVKDALKLLDALGYVKVLPALPYVRFRAQLSFPFWRLIGVIQKSYIAKKGG